MTDFRVADFHAVFRYKSDAAEITRSTGIGDLSDISQMCVPLRPVPACMTYNLAVAIRARMRLI